MKQLPKLPSKLIRVALTDLKKVEKSKKYHVNMHYWHAPSFVTEGVCEVCLAGAVIAKTIGYKQDAQCFPERIKSEERRYKIFAIDFLRKGEVGRAFSCLGRLSQHGSQFNRDIAEYRFNREQFFSDMEKLAADLEEKGY